MSTQTSSSSLNAAATDTAVAARTPTPLMQRADRMMLVGLVLLGTWAFGVIGVPFLLYGFLLMRKAQERGELFRPWSVTIIGAYCIIDVAVNYFGWGTDLLPAHDTDLIATLWSGYGKIADGGYYINYNGGWLGGLAHIGEKTLEFGCIFIMYPMRIASAWAFLRMKRWGLQGMVVTSWIYLTMWVSYIVPSLFENYDERLGASIFGAAGFWFMAIPYASPFILLPYFYTLDRRGFSEGP